MDTATIDKIPKTMISNETKTSSNRFKVWFTIILCTGVIYVFLFHYEEHNIEIISPQDISKKFNEWKQQGDSVSSGTIVNNGVSANNMVSSKNMDDNEININTTEPGEEKIDATSEKNEIPLKSKLTLNDKLYENDPFIKDLDLRINSYWNPDLINNKVQQKQGICQSLDSLSKETDHKGGKRGIAKFSIDCKSFLEKTDIGVGDWLASFYAMRLATLVHKDVDMYMECKQKDIDESDALKKALILPWVMGYWPSIDNPSVSDSNFNLDIKSHSIPFSQVCGNYDTTPIGYMINYMRFELRRMAVAIAGIPHENHPSAKFAKEYLWTTTNTNNNEGSVYQLSNPQPNDEPLAPDLEIDDVAIQFTCGYVLGGTSNSQFAFQKFKSYRTRISPNVTSIGIITVAEISTMGGWSCARLVLNLHQYLADAFPNAKVHIRNDKREGPATVWTRLIMANQTFGGLTSFGAFPVAATFGTGYMVYPKSSWKVRNKWMTILSNLYPNDIIMMDDSDPLETFEMKSEFKRQGMDKKVYWLKTDEALLSDPYPPEKTITKDDMVIRNTDLIYNSYWQGDAHICQSLDKVTESAKSDPDHPNKNAMLNITFNCQYVFDKSELGTGNWFSAIYNMRLATIAYGGVGMNIACDDAWEKKKELLLPWIMGYWPARESNQIFPWPHPDSVKSPLGLPRMKDVCGNYDQGPVGYMTPFIRYELRRMAIAIAGIPSDDHPSKEYAEKYLWTSNEDNHDIYQIPLPKRGDPPLIPGLEFDDVGIHFRCGDLMGRSHPSFGFMKFTAYKKWISPEARSIGIVTNPFKEGSQNRGGHARNADKCGIIVTALKEYLEDEYPHAKVIIRNDEEETIVTSYVRLIMANQTFTSISSFGVFPVVATFGTGYIKKPDFPKVPNKWIPFVSEKYDDVIMMDEKAVLMSGTAIGWSRERNGMEKVLYWFKNEDFKEGDKYPPS